MMEFLKPFAAIINAVIGLTTLVTILWGILGYVYGMKDDVSSLRHDFDNLSARVDQNADEMRMQIGEIRTAISKGK